MPVTIAPSAEAMQAIVDRINTGSGLTYTLASAATYLYMIDQKLDKATTNQLTVFVVHENGETLDECLDAEGRTSHDISIRVRQRLAGDQAAAIDAILLVTRQVFQRLNNFDSSSGRVRVWECDEPPEEIDRQVMRQLNIGEASFSMRVEVEASP